MVVKRNREKIFLKNGYSFLFCFEYFLLLFIIGSSKTVLKMNKL